MPGSPRATLNPALSHQETRQFRFLTWVQEDQKVRKRFKVGSGALYTTVFAIGILTSCQVGEQDPEAGISTLQAFFVVFIGLAIALYCLGRYLDSDPVVRLPSGGRILPEELAEPETEHLLTLQEAVDTILESPLHREGLLDDTIRSRVVLRDVEWSIARQLIQLSAARRRIDRTPVSGPQSQAAADQARAELTRRQRPALAQIDTITEHAQHVAAAEAQVADTESARYLTELASGIAEQAGTESITEADAASLASLRLAKESARRIAELAPGH